MFTVYYVIHTQYLLNMADREWVHNRPLGLAMEFMGIPVCSGMRYQDKLVLALKLGRSLSPKMDPMEHLGWKSWFWKNTFVHFSMFSVCFLFVDFWSASFPVGAFFFILGGPTLKTGLRMVAVYFVAIIFTASLAYRPSAAQTSLWRIWEPAKIGHGLAMVHVGPKLVGVGFHFIHRSTAQVQPATTPQWNSMPIRVWNLWCLAACGRGSASLVLKKHSTEFNLLFIGGSKHLLVFKS